MRKIFWDNPYQSNLASVASVGWAESPANLLKLSQKSVIKSKMEF
jgi:hypothetical protein